MSFDVHITIVGICNLTPGTNAMLVTMPKNHHHQHEARLYYDTAYQTAGNTEYKRVFFAHNLDGKSVDVPAHTADLDLTLPGDIIDGTKDLGWGRLKPGALNAGNDAKSVVSLGCGGVSDYISTLPFRMNGKVRMPANVVTWTIRGLTGSTFDFTITRGGKPQSVSLHPMRGCVRLFLVHVPPKELPSDGFHRFPSNVAGRLDHIDEFMSLYESANKVTVEEAKGMGVVQWQEEGQAPVGHKAAEVSFVTWVGACFSLRGQA